jgi:hypothetical protein
MALSFSDFSPHCHSYSLSLTFSPIHLASSFGFLDTYITNFPPPYFLSCPDTGVEKDIPGLSRRCRRENRDNLEEFEQ